jgi:hypothetical protein
VRWAERAAWRAAEADLEAVRAAERRAERVDIYIYNSQKNIFNDKNLSFKLYYF